MSVDSFSSDDSAWERWKSADVAVAVLMCSPDRLRGPSSKASRLTMEAVRK